MMAFRFRSISGKPVLVSTAQRTYLRGDWWIAGAILAARNATAAASVVFSSRALAAAK